MSRLLVSIPTLFWGDRLFFFWGYLPPPPLFLHPPLLSWRVNYLPVRRGKIRCGDDFYFQPPAFLEATIMRESLVANDLLLSIPYSISNYLMCICPMHLTNISSGQIEWIFHETRNQPLFSRHGPLDRTNEYPRYVFCFDAHEFMSPAIDERRKLIFFFFPKAEYAVGDSYRENSRVWWCDVALKRRETCRRSNLF